MDDWINKYCGFMLPNSDDMDLLRGNRQLIGTHVGKNKGVTALAHY